MSDFAGVDFSQYHNWRPVRTPTGGTYYVVPGTSFVYDPFLSSTRGRPVLWTNPEPTLKEKADAEKAQKQASSPLGQIAGSAGTITGAIAAPIAVHEVNSWLDKAPPTPPGTNPAPSMVGAVRGSGGGSAGGGGADTGASLTADTSRLAPGSTGEAFAQGANPGLAQEADGSVTPATNWGAYAQGGAGALQALSGVQQLGKGNYLGGGINTATGLANISAGLTNLGVSGVGGETAAAALPYLNPAAAAYGLYQTAKVTGGMPSGGGRNTNAALGGAATGAAIGSIIPGLGTGIGALIGGAAGFLGSSAFGSHKNSQQMIRDQGRKYLQSTGILDDNYQGTLADGSKFDFGKDRHEMAKLDYKDPVTGKLIALSNVLSAGEGNTGKSQEAMSELYTNAALSNAGGDLNKGIANIRHFADQRGFNQQNVQAQLDQLLADKKIDQHEHDVFSADAGQLFTAPTGAATPPGTYTGWHPGDPVHQLGKQLAARANARDKKK